MVALITPPEQKPKRKRLKMTTPNEVRRAICRIAVMVLNGEMDTKTANTILYACNSVLGAIRTDDQQRKLDELELTVLEMQEREKLR